MPENKNKEELLLGRKNGNAVIIAGPCSAESEYQVVKTAQEISKCKKVKIYRAGIWKPRTEPGNFEGVGEKGLAWLRKVKEKTSLYTATETATPEHVELCLRNNDAVDILWIGARTTANPFSVQTIADALKGVDIPVMVKNPLNPDIKLWAGAIERLKKAGIKNIAAIHRGFYPFEKISLRNLPKWELAIEIKSIFPDMPVINDPSHISGKRKYIQEIAQKALNLNLDGLMIETHIEPENALSDSKQQLTPAALIDLLNNLTFRKSSSDNTDFLTKLDQYRDQIDSIDYQMLELLSKRMKIVENIGKYKLNNGVTIFQLKRWLEMSKTRNEFGKSIGLDKNFIKRMLQLVHRESIRQQSEVMNKNKE
ncbi:MAG: bifunctional 3-deoxy-7-phosphoheptulonate synthase/chorismate mutase type II [Bacteroidales bacterium]|nr:bifunctional 3-deoxy-7-phosphoheptulonate synthase/chorismate mutase type II [Bacteroidales bacterium]